MVPSNLSFCYQLIKFYSFCFPFVFPSCTISCCPIYKHILQFVLSLKVGFLKLAAWFVFGFTVNLQASKFIFVSHNFAHYLLCFCCVNSRCLRLSPCLQIWQSQLRPGQTAGAPERSGPPAGEPRRPRRCLLHLWDSRALLPLPGTVMLTVCFAFCTLLVRLLCPTFKCTPNAFAS